MQEQPLVSIIIPVYNTEKYLRQCLDSVVNQTLKDIEIICVNDGSTDNSLNILKEYKEKDNRIKVFNIENHGVSYARNLGLNNVSGEYVVFIDSDDYVNDVFIEELYNNELETFSDLVFSGRILKNKDDKIISKWIPKKEISYNPINDYDDFTQWHTVVEKLFKYDIIKQNRLYFDETLCYGEDSLFLTQYLSYCYKITAVKKAMYTVVENKYSLSRNLKYKEKRKHQKQIVLNKNKEIKDSYIKNNNYPLVSIILTLYEIKPEYLNDCLNSLLNQTYRNIEIVAINDCSPTINYDYITKLSSRIYLFKNNVNLKLCKTVNKAFKLARGKYIIRVGSDDYFDSTLLEKEVTVLEKNSNVGAVCCELQRFGKKDQHIKRPQVWNLKNILNGNISGVGYAGGMMFRSKLLEEIKIDEQFRVCEDLDFHLQILEKTSIESIHEVLYFYRSHDTNIMKSIKNEERKQIVKQILLKHNKIYLIENNKINKIIKKKNKYF